MGYDNPLQGMSGTIFTNVLAYKSMNKLGTRVDMKWQSMNPQFDFANAVKHWQSSGANLGASGIGKVILSSDDVIFNGSSIDKAFGKHGTDFGTYPDGSKASVNAFTNDIKNLIDNGSQVKGTYRATPGTHVYNPSSKQWSFINEDGTFNTAFKLSAVQYKYLIETGEVK